MQNYGNQHRKAELDILECLYTQYCSAPNWITNTLRWSSISLVFILKAFTRLPAHRTLRKSAYRGCLLNPGCKQGDRWQSHALQDHALPESTPSERWLMPMVQAAPDTVYPESQVPSRDLGKPIWSEECGLCFGAHEMPSGWLADTAWGWWYYSHFFCFKFLFNFILLLAMPWHAGPSSQTRNQTHTPDCLKFVEYQPLANQAVSTLILSPASLFSVTRL